MLHTFYMESSWLLLPICDFLRDFLQREPKQTNQKKNHYFNLILSKLHHSVLKNIFTIFPYTVQRHRDEKIPLHLLVSSLKGDYDYGHFFFLFSFSIHENRCSTKSK